MPAQKTRTRKMGAVLMKPSAVVSMARTHRTVRGHTGTEGDIYAMFKPQPKAGKGARCLTYVLARGNVLNRKGFGREKHVRFGPSSNTN